MKEIVMRRHLILTSLTVLLLAPVPALAQNDMIAEVITRIEANGYTVTDVRRSWLGRTVITATNENGLREIVLNRTSGAVMRDQKFPNERPRAENSPPPSSPAGGPKAPGRSDGPGGSTESGGSGGPGNPGGGG